MFYFGLEVSHPGYTHKSEAYCTQSLKARQAVNSAKSDTDRNHKEWNHHVRGAAFNALSKQTHNTRATAVSDAACVLAVVRCGHVPLSLEALWVWFFNRRVGGPEVTEAPLARGSHVRDVPQVVVQRARGGTL